MSAAPTLSYPSSPAPKQKKGSRRTKLIVSSIIVVLTLVCGAIAADRIIDFSIEQRITTALEPYAEADVSVEGFPVLTQLAGGQMDTVHITADSAEYEGVGFTEVDARLYDVPVDTSRPIGTVEASAVIPLATIDSLAAVHANLPEGTSFTTVNGVLQLKGSFLGQDLLIGLDPQADSRRVTVSATTITLGSAEIDLGVLPGFLTSAISDIVIDLDFLPPGLQLTKISASDAGLQVELHGTGVTLG